MKLFDDSSAPLSNYLINTSHKVNHVCAKFRKQQISEISEIVRTSKELKDLIF
jgi:hypothetical protein